MYKFIGFKLSLKAYQCNTAKVVLILKTKPSNDLLNQDNMFTQGYLHFITNLCDGLIKH